MEQIMRASNRFWRWSQDLDLIGQTCFQQIHHLISFFNHDLFLFVREGQTYRVNNKVDNLTGGAPSFHRHKTLHNLGVSHIQWHNDEDIGLNQNLALFIRTTSPSCHLG